MCPWEALLASAGQKLEPGRAFLGLESLIAGNDFDSGWEQAKVLLHSADEAKVYLKKRNRKGSGGGGGSGVAFELTAAGRALALRLRLDARLKAESPGGSGLLGPLMGSDPPESGGASGPVTLLVDFREGGGERHRLAELCGHLDLHRVPYEVRHLPVGDFLFQLRGAPAGARSGTQGTNASSRSGGGGGDDDEVPPASWLQSSASSSSSFSLTSSSSSSSSVSSSSSLVSASSSEAARKRASALALEGRGRVAVLPVIVERKSAYDVALSMMDGRWGRQKLQMLAARDDPAFVGGSSSISSLSGGGSGGGSGSGRQCCELVYVVEGALKGARARCCDKGCLAECGGPTLAQAEAELADLARQGFDLVR